MRSWPLVLGIVLSTSFVVAQDRDTKVRNDRKAYEASTDWIYNSLPEGIRSARDQGKPLLVVFRCIPCEACQEFDDDVARRDPIIRELLDRFVCVRIVQANTIDLAHFQHDFDQSFALYLMNPDLTIYGRFGTRSDRPEEEDISLEGLRKAMIGALRMHASYETVKPRLAGKQVKSSPYRTPRDYPSLSGKYDERIDYEGQTAKSCMHCHQVREAERLVYRSASKPIPDPVLFPYPDPAVLGLKMDSHEMAKVETVETDSPAARAGVKPGDDIVTLDGQPLLSIADLQWVLHESPSAVKLPAQIRRDGTISEITFDLPEGWRRGDISWRVTSWELRRMGLGGMRLEELTDDQRNAADLAKDQMGLKVLHVGEYGEHAVAKKAGLRKDDVVVSFDGLTQRMTESQLLAHTLQQKRPGDEVVVEILRDGEKKALRFLLQ